MSQSPQNKLKSITSRMITIDSQTQRVATQRRKQLEGGLRQKLRCKSQKQQQHDDTQQKIDRLYNKRIFELKPIFESKSNTQALPFIVALRSTRNRMKTLPITTVLQPFEVSKKQTINQKMRKRVSDINADSSRIYNAYYRLNANNGVSTRASCDFQCKLREQSLAKSTGDPSFRGFVRPAHLKKVEERKFKRSQLVCQHQQKSFTLLDQKQ